ncbi:MAG: hypothetical protein DIZ80_06420 [endosymbiont of Galathealinum brachiosum]|uniref:Sulphotransferase Stf0 domain-containing protein n=1 Tax=endosymbiont of Galathealinum brachiosum TaxID=2200906 RepID=A0A370DFS1_9GAMM|nr:MAG: hypothetical protein DIZ80_06420 [endosymbiont of Galathealinum brachiosum]
MTFDKNNNIFVVISEPRTGSTVLTHKLELIDNVSCQGEIFHPDNIHSSVTSDSIPTLQQRQSSPIEFLSKVVEQTYLQRGNSKLIGFKLFFDHNEEILKYVIEKKTPIVLLERTNKLAQYSSLKIAQKTGIWNSGDTISKEQEELNKKRGKKVSFSMIEFIGYSLRSSYRFKSLIKKLKKSNSPYYYMKYESMFDAKEWENMINFLHIESANSNINPSYKKQNKGSIFDRFSNKNYAYYCCKLLMTIPFIPNSIKPISNIFD